MNIITLDGKTYNVKYIQRNEVITTDMHTAVYNYPDYEGSKTYHNSSSSEKFAMNFTIHTSERVDFTRSIKKVLSDETEAVEHPTYGKLTHIVIEHDKWGAIKGSVVGGLKVNSGSEADILCSFIFVEHSQDTQILKKDFEDETNDAVDDIDTEISDNFDVDLSTQDKSTLSKLSDSMNSLYDSFQNSSIVSAFNDLNTELNKATLDSLAVMNSFKKIVELPNDILSDSASRLDLLQSQADTIIASPVNTYNLTLFNANLLAYNVGISSRAAFVSDSATESAAGLKTVPLND